MSDLEGFFSGAWGQALGWTLLHSVWQGVLAALVLALVLSLTRKFSASGRYLIALMMMGIVLTASSITFQASYRAEVRGRIVAGNAAGGPVSGFSSFADRERKAAEADLEPGFVSQAGLFLGRLLRRYFPLLVAVWLDGIAAFSVFFAGGFAWNRRLRIRACPAPENWQARCDGIAARVGLGGPVRLLESARVAGPLVLGQLKPVILLPLGLLSGLPGEQAEAILIHELAHVLRRDTLANFLQSLVDILFFFHPAVRWISSVARAEREHCCDDLVIKVSGRAAPLARALVDLQSPLVTGEAPAVFLSGRGGPLTRRIRRLITRHKLAPDVSERFASAAVLLAAVLVLIGAAGASERWTISEIVELQAASGQGGKAQAAADESGIGNNVFDMPRSGRVEVMGETAVRAGKSPVMLSWIVDEATGRVLWRLSSEMIRDSEGSLSYRETVDLDKGRYRWFFTRDEVTILKILAPASPAAAVKGAVPGRAEQAAAAAPPFEPIASPASSASGPASRFLDFSTDWKGRLRRVRAVVEEGRVQGFALDNITFLRADIEKNWTFIVRVLSDREQRRYLYKHPRGAVIDPRK